MVRYKDISEIISKWLNLRKNQRVELGIDSIQRVSKTILLGTLPNLCLHEPSIKSLGICF